MVYQKLIFRGDKDTTRLNWVVVRAYKLCFQSENCHSNREYHYTHTCCNLRTSYLIYCYTRSMVFTKINIIIYIIQITSGSSTALVIQNIEEKQAIRRKVYGKVEV